MYLLNTIIMFDNGFLFVSLFIHAFSYPAIHRSTQPYSLVTLCLLNNHARFTTVPFKLLFQIKNLDLIHSWLNKSWVTLRIGYASSITYILLNYRHSIFVYNKISRTNTILILPHQVQQNYNKVYPVCSGIFLFLSLV